MHSLLPPSPSMRDGAPMGEIVQWGVKAWLFTYMASSMEADISTFTNFFTLEAAGVTCIPIYICNHDRGRHFNNRLNTIVSWRLPNIYPESYDCGLPGPRPTKNKSHDILQISWH